MPLAVDGTASLPESRGARTDGERPSGSVVAGEISAIDAESAFVGPEDLASKRRRPWDVALAKRFHARADLHAACCAWRLGFPLRTGERLCVCPCEPRRPAS